MKIKEDHIIIALVILIIFVIWSKFMTTSGYAVGQALAPGSFPTLSILNQDIILANWTGVSTSTVTGSTDSGSTTTYGKAIATANPSTDKKLQPGDLNRQGWAISGSYSGETVNTTNFQFAGFRKTLQAGGGGDVYYLFTKTGKLPGTLSSGGTAGGSGDYTQSASAGSLLSVGTFNIPKYVLYAKSINSPFVDGGCTYRIVSTGATTATKCGQVGTSVQTLQLTKAPTGTTPCIGPDGETDLTSATTASGRGTTTAGTITAKGASSGKAVSSSDVGGLSGANYFSNTITDAQITSGVQMFFAVASSIAGCGGTASAGFIQNNGTVLTIAGNGTSGTTDGIGIGGSFAFPGGQLPAQFASPAYIATGGSGNTVANVFVASTTSGTSVKVRNMFLETYDTPSLWQVLTISTTVANSGATCAGLVADRQAVPKIYYSDTTNNKIYKFDPTGSLAATWTMPTSSGLAGLFIDASSGTTTGTYLYACTSSAVYAIPVSTGNLDLSSTVNGIGVVKIPVSGAAPNQITVSNPTSTGGGTAYVTEASPTNSTGIWFFTVPALSTSAAASTATSITMTKFAGGGSTPGTQGAKDTGSLGTTGQIAVDLQGNLYGASVAGHLITKVDQTGTISTFTGGGVAIGGTVVSGSADSGLSATTSNQPGGGATFNGPSGFAIAADGLTMFVGDTANNIIRMVV